MLVALWDVSNQFNDNNGSILTNGKVYVYYSGRAALAPTWSSADGSHVNPNPIILDNNGRAVAFADDQYTYTCVVCDFYGRELFSFDPASFGTGGGGSTTEGNDAAHWIGATGTDVQVTALADTLLPLPPNPDYEGDFVAQTTYTTISLNKGLYMVDADIRIQQDDDDLENIIKDISVYTGLTGTDSLITSQKNWTGPEASDDRHYIHVHFIRHVADEGEDIYFQMNSPVDLSSAWIDKLSIVKLTEGGNGKSYVGGYGIQIEGQVISTSGMMPESSAANFVDNSTYQVDIQNIYDTIAETSAMIPSGVATEQYVQDYTSAFITEDALNGYATQEWVEDQGYITSADIPPIPEDVVTSGELATVSGDIVSQIPSLNGYATEQWVNEQNFITSADLPQSVPLVAGEGISIVDTSASTIISCSGAGVSEEWVENYTSAFITASVLDDYVTENDFNEAVSGLSDDISAVSAAIPSLDGYATEQFVEDYSSAFITEDALNGYATQQWVEDQHYITSADIPDVPADVVTSGQLATVSGEIVNQIPDVSDMATQTWVNEQGYLTSIPDEYVTSGELATVSGDIMSQIPSQTTVSIDPTLSSGTKIAEFNINGTSGELYAPNGGGSTYTAGDNISIVNDEISVSGTAGLIAGENITFTASGDNYVISSTGGGSTGIPSQLYHNSQDPSPAIFISTFGTESAYNENTSATLENNAHIKIDGATIETSYGSNAPRTTITPQSFYSTDGANAPVTDNRPGTISLSLGTSGYVHANYNGYVEAKEISSGKTFDSRDALQTTDLTIVNNEITEISGYSIAGGGGGSDPLEVIDGCIQTTTDKKTLFFDDTGDIAPANYEKTALWNPISPGSAKAYVYNPWARTSSTSNLITLFTDEYVSDAYHLAWFPTNDSSRYIRYKEFQRSYVSGGYYIWRTSGRAYIKNGYYSYTVEPPTGTGTDFDTTKFDVIGDWSSVSTPIMTWYLAFIDEQGNITQAGFSYVESETHWSVAGSRTTVRLKSGGGISRDPFYGLYVTNPVPNATNNQGYVLTENGDGTFGWAAPAGGGGLDQVYHDASLTGSGTSASPLSITSASNWTEAYNAVNDSASYWNDAAGMNEYPISAGPGMSIEDVDGVTVFQTSGTMMDDLIEYNSQDEISGYNGHPVMTVDSEKQWLTHDDTIAHVTNSAQYAFGVNVPVVAQAMGTDETELWSGNNVTPSSTAIVVSEALSNFNSVKFYWTAGNGMSEPVDEVQVDASGADLHFVHCTGGTNMWLQTLRLGISGTSITLQWAKNLNFGSGTSTTWSNPTITTTVGDSFQLTKIVGIGRKEN